MLHRRCHSEWSGDFFPDSVCASKLFGKTVNPHRTPVKPPVLEKLRKEKIKTAVASNWDERLPQLLSDLQLAPFFDHQFISVEIGYSKPHPQFFKTCLDRLGLEAAQVLHIGDDDINDVKAAEQVGIGSYRIDRNSAGVKGPKTLTTLEEVLTHI